jgi:beta-lactamase class A
MMLMLTISDNCASLWLQGLAGGGTRIKSNSDSLGYKVTRVNAEHREEKTLEACMAGGKTSPREIATIMENM